MDIYGQPYTQLAHIFPSKVATILQERAYETYITTLMQTSPLVCV